MLEEREARMLDGRVVRVYDSGPVDGPDSLTVLWNHGTPQTGLPPTPFVAEAARYGLRWVSIDRPGYGISTPLPGRDVAAVVPDVATVADVLGLDRFAVLGASGGGPHVLACAALLPDRVVAAACIATIAPFDATGLDWFDGMATSGTAEFRAAARGRASLTTHIAEHAFGSENADLFGPADATAFNSSYWPWLTQSAVAGMTTGRDGWVDDDLAFVERWGFTVDEIRRPVLLMHGQDDLAAPSSHAHWIADQCPAAELQIHPHIGHFSIFNQTSAAIEWLRQASQAAADPRRR